MAYLKEHDEHIATDLWYTASVVYVSSSLGSILIEECDVCGYLDVACEHKRNEWNDEGTHLYCILCGVDGT